MERVTRTFWWLFTMLIGLGTACAGENLIEDSSFEMPREADQFGLVFEKWGGWNYEGDCRFAIGSVSHSGRTSSLLIGRSSPKIRIRQEHELEPGRYRVTAFIRGLDIGAGTWNAPYHEAQLEPLRQSSRSFVAFRLTVTNKTGTELQIDWNKTRYLFNDNPYGLYVFRGVEPEAIKYRTIAPDIIPPRDVFTKIIAPQKLIAYATIREQHKLGPGESALSGGPIPAGESGILLVVRLNGEEIRERLTVDITEVEYEGQ